MLNRLAHVESLISVGEQCDPVAELPAEECGSVTVALGARLVLVGGDALGDEALRLLDQLGVGQRVPPAAAVHRHDPPVTTEQCDQRQPRHFGDDVPQSDIDGRQRPGSDTGAQSGLIWGPHHTPQRIR